MKNPLRISKVLMIVTLVIIQCCSITLFAQSPQKFNYQAACRDNLGNIIANQVVTLRFSIRDLSPGGTVLYSETQYCFHQRFWIGKR